MVCRCTQYATGAGVLRSSPALERRLVILIALVAACGGAAHLAPVPPGVRLWEVEDHTTEGEIFVEGEPASIYAAVSVYARWAQIFSDVATVEDQGADGDEEMVKLVTTEGQNNNLRFKNDPAHHVVRFRDTGGIGDVWAEIAFEPAPGGGTRVHARLHGDVHGLYSLVITDAKLRDERRKKLTSDLSDILRYFGKSAGKSR